MATNKKKNTLRDSVTSKLKNLPETVGNFVENVTEKIKGKENSLPSFYGYRGVDDINISLSSV